MRTHNGLHTSAMVVVLGAASACAVNDATELSDETVTWNNRVEDIVDENCVRCHQPNGVGPGDFTDLEDVVVLAPLMLQRIDAGEMPPPAADPECYDYHNSDTLFMPVEDRNDFARWVDGGLPIGEKIATEASSENDAATPRIFQGDLDVVLPPFTPTYTENGNEYRCFALDHGRDETFYVTALDALIDQSSVVHHVVLSKRRDTELGEEYGSPDGVDCIDQSGDIAYGMLAGWAPGAAPVEFPEGYGLRIEPNDKIIIQMHYYRSGPNVDGLVDQSGYTFRTTTEPVTEVEMYPYGDGGFRIPAGDPSYTHNVDIEIPEEIDLGNDLIIEVPPLLIHGSFPHMHVLGSGYHMKVESLNGDKQCLLKGDFDFHNQYTYMFKEPIRIEPGDTISFSCTWNNSVENPNQINDPPQDVYYGERTDEEMCFAFSYVTVLWDEL